MKSTSSSPPAFRSCRIVPRWATDANFFPIIAQTKALPQLLGDVRQAIADAWPTSA